MFAVAAALEPPSVGMLEEFFWIIVSMVGYVGHWALLWSPLIAWCAWWLWGADWRKIWPVLAEGAWVALLLLAFVSALVWSRMDPRSSAGLPNFWWQFLAVTSLVLLAMFCGWLQHLWNWQPAEVDLDPPEAAHDAAHASH